MVYQFITRSKGVVFFSVSLIAFGTFGAFLMILSVLLLSLKDLPAFQGFVPVGVLSLTMFWVSSAASLFVFIAWVICGIGAIHLHDWARKWLRVVMGLHVINMFVNILLNVFLAEEMLSRMPYGFLATGVLISFSYYFSVVHFFSHPNVVRQFKYKSREY
jgi:hypothetical protein